MFATILALCVAVSAAQNDQYFGSETFQKVMIPEKYRPTSPVGIAAWKFQHVEYFYRGPNYQLIHVTLFQQGNVTAIEDLGGTLLTAPAAVSPSKGKLDVAYVTTGLRIVTRSFRNGRWGPEVSAGIRSALRPALSTVDEYDDDDRIFVFATRLDGQVVQRSMDAGVWSEIKRMGVKSNHAPAAGMDHQGVNVYMLNRNNKIVSDESIRSMPRFTSGICASASPEFGFLLLGRGTNGGLVGALRLDEDPWSTISFAESPWMDGPPSCFFAFSNCAEIVINHRGDLHRGQYCS